MRATLYGPISFALLLFSGCNESRSSAAASGGAMSDAAAPAGSDVECAQLRAELGGNPETLRAQRRTFRERVTARFGAEAFQALRKGYGGRCDDEADFRCVLDEIGPFARVECVSPTRHVPEQLYADGPTFRRVDGVDGVKAFELGLRSAERTPTELEPILTLFQRTTRVVILRDKKTVGTFVPAADAESIPASTLALIPPTLADGSAQFAAYADQGYQAPRAFLEVRVDLARLSASINRISLKPTPYPAGQEQPRQREEARLGGERYDGSESAICAWGTHRGDVRALPSPAGCGPGLLCCSGGAAGSDSFCTRASGDGCPVRP